LARLFLFLVSSANFIFAGAPISECVLSFPVVGKHLSFNGNYLHGAPKIPLVMEDNSIKKSDNLRVTFLVNIWLSNHPQNVQPLDPHIVDALNSEWSELSHHSFNISDVSILQSELNVTAISVDDKVIKKSNGNFQKCVLPFVSNDSIWGKEEGTSGITMRVWLPTSTANIDKTIAKKGKKKVTGEADNDIAIDKTTIVLTYKSESVCASLEYETESDIEENDYVEWASDDEDTEK
jgi:hypothetical protein